MDVSNWPLNNILQLPDSCFGQRFEISFSAKGVDPATVYLISELALPEVAVLHELSIDFGSFYIPPAGPAFMAALTMRFVLADQIPTVATLPNFENMFQGFDGVDHEVVGRLHLCRLRKAYRVSGRRVALAVTSDSTGKYIWNASMVFSGLPKEVPDCLLSV